MSILSFALNIVLNYRDTILHKVKDQACYKSGIIPPEYQDELCVERTFLTIVREAEILL